MTATRRKSNWPALLDLFLQEKRDLPFDWATNNCAFFTADWIAICMGADPLAHLRSEVKTKLDAAKVLKLGKGIEHLSEAICAAHGWPEIDVRMAQRGDICLGNTEEGPALGVCLGRETVFSGPDGLRTLPTKTCLQARRIG